MKTRLKYVALSFAMLFCEGMAFGQSDDAVVMRVNGREIRRSAFYHSYRQARAQSADEVLTPERYLPLYVDYALKVEAALEAGLDTLSDWAPTTAKKLQPWLDADLEREAQAYYEQLRQRVVAKGGLVKPAQILLRLGQRDSKAKVARARARIDSIHGALKQGGDFAAAARRLSQDSVSANKGGEMEWLERGTTLKEFEDVAFSLGKGEMSRPFESPEGFHIVLLKDKCDFLPYDSLRADLLAYVDMQRLRRRINHPGPRRSTADGPVGGNAMAAMSVADSLAEAKACEDMLVYAICSRQVWAKAVADEAGLQRFFRKNRKRYRWVEPRFRGIVYAADRKLSAKDVRNRLAQESQDGLFRRGDNAVVDRLVFKMPATAARKTHAGLYEGVYGKKYTTPKQLDEVRDLVVADYQEALEREWLQSLHRKYKVEILRDILLKNENN